MTFRVLTTCGVFEPGFRGGGPIKSVVCIVDTVPDDVELSLITRDRDLGGGGAYPGLSGRWSARGRSRVFYLNTGRLGQWIRLWRSLRGQRFDLLYVNSLWSPKFSVVPILAAWTRLIHAGRILVAPRGELSPGALAQKATKKRIFLSGWSRLLRRLDVWWHATSEREAEMIAEKFPAARIELCLSQTGLPIEPMAPLQYGYERARFVFIGRIAPIKNLLLAVQALQCTTSPLLFDIYGPIEDARYWALCSDAVASLPATTTVRYLGEIQPHKVRPTFAAYDAFVFPTLGENFGHVIAESLSASCPVICADTTPWTATLNAGGGVVVSDLTASTLGLEIERIAIMTAEDRHKARRMAGDAYRVWRADQLETNILAQVRLSTAGSR